MFFCFFLSFDQRKFVLYFFRIVLFYFFFFFFFFFFFSFFSFFSLKQLFKQLSHFFSTITLFRLKIGFFSFCRFISLCFLFSSHNVSFENYSFMFLSWRNLFRDNFIVFFFRENFFFNFFFLSTQSFFFAFCRCSDVSDFLSLDVFFLFLNFMILIENIRIWCSFMLLSFRKENSSVRFFFFCERCFALKFFYFCSIRNFFFDVFEDFLSSIVNVKKWNVCSKKLIINKQWINERKQFQKKIEKSLYTE